MTQLQLHKWSFLRTGSLFRLSSINLLLYNILSFLLSSAAYNLRFFPDAGLIKWFWTEFPPPKKITLFRLDFGLLSSPLFLYSVYLRQISRPVMSSLASDVKPKLPTDYLIIWEHLPLWHTAVQQKLYHILLFFKTEYYMLSEIFTFVQLFLLVVGLSWHFNSYHPSNAIVFTPDGLPESLLWLVFEF